MTQEQLVQRLNSVFGKSNPPEYITIRPFLKEDSYVVEIEERFKKKPREKLTVQDVAWLITDIIWLSENALKYYLPKMLEIAIQTPFLLENFDLFPMQLADEKIIEEKFGFITRRQAEFIVETLQIWQANKKLMEKFCLTNELQKAITYWIIKSQ
jgi:hypothetical protein